MSNQDCGTVAAARQVGLSLTHFLRQVDAGRIPFTRDATGRRRFALAALQAFDKARRRRQRALARDYYTSSAT